MSEYDPGQYRQGNDRYKEQVIAPHLANLIYHNIPIAKDVRMIDFGTGDSSALSVLTNQLKAKEITVSDLLLLEIDTSIFPNLIANSLQRDQVATAIADYTINPGYHLLPDPNSYEGKYDIGISQMVFHQIQNDALLSLMLFRLSRALSDSGIFFVVDINPQFIEYLARTNSAKYERLSERQGNYVFSNGIKIPYINRSISEILGKCISVGMAGSAILHEVGVTEGSMWERYNMLFQGFPSSNILEVHKPENSKTSFFEGTLDKVRQISYNLFEVSFSDRAKYTLPLPGATKLAKRGDFIVVCETELPDETNFLNVWITNAEGVNHGQGKIYLKD